jgi:hypothetical protein
VASLRESAAKQKANEMASRLPHYQAEVAKINEVLTGMWSADRWVELELKCFCVDISVCCAIFLAHTLSHSQGCALTRCVSLASV